MQDILKAPCLVSRRNTARSKEFQHRTSVWLTEEQPVLDQEHDTGDTFSKVAQNLWHVMP